MQLSAIREERSHHTPDSIAFHPGRKRDNEMVQYRRSYVPGGTYFFTVTLQNRPSTLLVDYVDLLRECFRNIKKDKPFNIEAMVIMPDHLHTIWTLPEHDADYSARWKAIKSLFTRKIKKAGVDIPSNTRGEHALWQKRFWEHTIQNEQDMNTHIDYIHFNPVKHGYVNSVKEWPYSSFHRYVDKGMLEKTWGGNQYEKESEGNFGE